MIDTKELTRELRSLVRDLETDIKDHCEATEAVSTWSRSEFARAKDAGRTGQAFESWRDEQITLSAVGWVLSCVFVRFCEDNGLIAGPRLAGPGERGDAAADTTRYFFQQHPGDSDREYLLWVFEEASKLPGMEALMQARDSRMHELPLSVDGATELLEFWRRNDAETGDLSFDFTDPDRGTRFLGDLYQDISEAARKRYALLQTPIFIEEFILDRTLDPAIEDFGLADASIIDPACGSGHFVLGSFHRLLARWRERKPESNVRVLCQMVFDRIAGVDINPFAVAIAHFRLLVAALDACDLRELRTAPAFDINVATGDSLLHGHPPGRLPDATGAWARPEHQHFYDVEDRGRITRILDRRYAAVVANPPYITPIDPGLRDAYRELYATCKGQYAMSVPFMERLFDLAAPAGAGRPAGYVGQITSNSFLKREFGKKLIEDFLTREVDLTEIIDTSGAYIPGHGTPTVILFGRARRPLKTVIRGVLGIRGEPTTPSDPSQGLVWQEISSLVDQPGAEGSYVSVEEVDRARLNRHPWSLQGGGAAETFDAIERGRIGRLGEIVDSIGFASFPGQDDAFVMDPQTARRNRLPEDLIGGFIEGEVIRDWSIVTKSAALAPNLTEEGSTAVLPVVEYWLWRVRSTIWSTISFGGKTRRDNGEPWWTWYRWVESKYRDPLSITFAFVATHNHFAIDYGAGVFKQSAPVIKLRSGSSESAHVELLGPLNCSAGCFWMKQVFMDRGGGGIGGGLAGEGWGYFYEHDSTKLAKFPLPSQAPILITESLRQAAEELVTSTPAVLAAERLPSVRELGDQHATWLDKGQAMIALQEELDWDSYRRYGLIDDDLTSLPEDVPGVELGERAFEIVLARKVSDGVLKTNWFERHGSTPTLQIPDRWPASYRSLMQRRIEVIEHVKAIKLIEQPEYKRRWTTLNPSHWESMVSETLRAWILDRLEADDLWPGARLQSATEVADRLLGEADFGKAVVLLSGEDVDPADVVVQLLAEEAVPYLAPLRYRTSGLDKRSVWERTWDLQRAEDEGKFVGSIDPPPKYKQSDFRSMGFWRFRGKLDMPKERFTSYPDATADGSTLYGWAGWDHAQRAQGLAERIVEAEEAEGLDRGRIVPLLAGLLELLPWLHQWHSEPDPDYGLPLSDFYESFLDERCRAAEVTRDELKAWRPPEPTRGRRRRSR